MTMSVPLWFVSLKCCSSFGLNVRFKSVNPSKILISLFMLRYPFEGIFGQTGCSRAVLFYFYTKKTKKVPTTNHVSEWPSVPNILEPVFV